MQEKFKLFLSRKFLSPIIFTILVWANQKFGQFFTENQISDLANLIIAFIVGEATIDAVRLYFDKK